jgi:hypothetical protein
MAAIGVYLNGGQGCWPEIEKRQHIDLMGSDAPPIQLALVARGMSDGESALILRIDLPDGQVVLTQASLPRFLEAAKALQLADAGVRRLAKERKPR